MTQRKRIAILLSRFPYPLDKGDKLRAFHQIVFLARYHDIHLFALSEDNVDSDHVELLAGYCTSIQLFPLRKSEIWIQSLRSLFANTPVQVGYFFSPSIKKKIHKALHDLQPDVVYGQLSRTALYLNDLPFHSIMDFQDAFSINYHRISERSTGWDRLFYRRESRCMERFERNMLNWFDTTTIISTFDKQCIAKGHNETFVVPNGVDTTYFKPLSALIASDLLFSGNLQYKPNQYAAEFIAKKLMPSLLKILPEIKIHIAGQSGDQLSSLANQHLTISGWVEDMRTLYSSTRIYVAPLFTGAGLQNKLLEAMSMGIPCITTSVSNASLQAINNEHLLIADDVDEFTQQIMRLLNDTDLQKKLATNGRLFVEKNYSWESCNQILLKLV